MMRADFKGKSDILIFFFLFVLIAWIFLFFSINFSYLVESFNKKIYSLTVLLEFLKAILEISLLTFGFIKRKKIIRWISEKLSLTRFQGTGEELSSVKEKIKGIVIPVSRRQQPEWIIRHLKPEYVALIYTQLSKKDALALTQEFSNTVHFYHTISDIEQEKDIIKNPDDPLETKNKTNKFILWLKAQGLDSQNIFVDTTGGKVPMSIGIFQSAEEHGISSIYIVGKNNGLITNPTDESHGYPIFLSRK